MKRPKCVFILSFAAVLSLAAPAGAEEWQILGARAMGMGGAGVAAARGTAATYWNPASLARSQGEGGTAGLENAGRFFDSAGGMSMTFAATGDAIEDYDAFRQDVEAYNFSAVAGKIEAGIPLTEAEIQGLLRIVGRDIPAMDQPGEGVISSLTGGMGARIWRVGFGFTGSIFGGAHPVVDYENLALGDQGIDAILGPGQDRTGSLTPGGQSFADQLAAGGSITQNQAEELVYQSEQAGVNTSDPGSQRALTSVVNATAANDGGDNSNSLANNRSGAEVRGMSLQELAVGYGQPIGDLIAVGVAAKAMHAWTYSKAYTAQDLPDVGDMVDDIIHGDREESSFNFGVDAGILVTPANWIALGVTGKNLNRPAFDLEGGGHLVIDPTARAGVALYPLPWLTLAADMDLFEYKSEILPGYESQVIGGGAQVDLGIVALRAGLSKNLADPGEDILIHAGIALRIWHFSLEAAAMVTPDFQGLVTEGDPAVPERAGAALTLGFDIDF